MRTRTWLIVVTIAAIGFVVVSMAISIFYDFSSSETIPPPKESRTLPVAPDPL